MKYRYLVSLILINFLLIGCTLPRRLEIASCKIKKEDVTKLKETILSKSYLMYDSVDDVAHCVDYGSFKDCYYLTRYTKKVGQTDKKNISTHISVSFKKFEHPSNSYRNLSVSLFPGNSDVSVINQEIDSMKNLIHKQLIEDNAECINVEIK